MPQLSAPIGFLSCRRRVRRVGVGREVSISDADRLHKWPAPARIAPAAVQVPVSHPSGLRGEAVHRPTGSAPEKETRMAAAGPKIRLGIADHDLNTGILNGTVKVDGFELELASGTDDGAIHQLLRDGKIDACEYSFGTLMGERAQGVPYISIPAFPNRKF